jgi:two-component system, NarL family, nitrate/nitrite response regulator NarL
MGRSEFFGPESRPATPPAESPTRSSLVLVEHHAILRECVRALLEMEEDLEVCGEAGSAVEAVELVRRVAPALVIMDLALPGASGIDLIGSLLQIQPCAKVLVLTAHASEEYVRAALRAGATGYVLKDTTRADLVKAVGAVLAGRTYLCPAVAAKVITKYLDEHTGESKPVTTEHVTNRERDVLKRVALGESNKSISSALGVSVKTVEKYRLNLKRKLALENTAAVTRFAMRHGIIPEPVCPLPVAPRPGTKAQRRST